ncbi:hypothetical protein GF389_03335 [Candidatus Dojkabacteria bacterium]|nr:hypothetical protein [Candidatus Dojkabacteria bacterium]
MKKLDGVTAMTLQGFNLLKPQKTPPTLWEKIYSWVLGTARIIVIIVEVIVVVAFGARIAVDTISSRLDKEIEKQQNTLGAYSESEQRFRTIQARTREYENIWEVSSNYAEMLFEIENYLLANFTDLSIEVSENELRISGEGDVGKISTLEDSLKSSEYLRNVEVYDLSAEEEGSRRSSFGIRAIIEDYNFRTLKGNGN